MTNTPPILLIIFKRPDTTQQVFERIRQAQPRKLFIAADGPRADHPGEAEQCAQTRAVVANIDWDCEVHTLYHDTNLGCGIGPYTAITWFFEHVSAGIILEDDCLPDLSFFSFCTELLDLYAQDERIGMVGGCNFLPGVFGGNQASYFLSYYTMVWGWATWRRAWEKMDFNLTLWPELRPNPRWLLEKVIEEDRLVYWTNIFENLYAGDRTQVWDYQWTFSLWTQNMLSVIPARNLVRNIGFGQDATHTKEDLRNLSSIPVEPISFPLQHPAAILRNVEIDLALNQRIFSPKRSVPRSLFIRVKRLLRMMLRDIQKEFAKP